MTHACGVFHSRTRPPSIEQGPLPRRRGTPVRGRKTRHRQSPRPRCNLPRSADGPPGCAASRHRLTRHPGRSAFDNLVELIALCAHPSWPFRWWMPSAGSGRPGHRRREDAPVRRFCATPSPGQPVAGVRCDNRPALCPNRWSAARQHPLLRWRACGRWMGGRWGRCSSPMPRRVC